ncbi:MAG TPA: hypothetical protein VNR89_02920 [Roseomonas sp.]|nr:hypothetical protein [Roseomonas sp.]
MSGVLGLPGPLGSGSALRVMGPDFPGRVQFSRASTALAQDASGAFQPLAANLPRFHGVARRLLVEEARANGIRNPAGEGISGGSTPTYWNIQNTPELTFTFSDAGMVDGIGCVRVRISGTATKTGTAIVNFDANTAVPAAPNQSWAASLYIRRVASAATLGPGGIRLIARTSAGSLAAAAESPTNSVPITDRLARVEHVRALGMDSSIAAIQSGLSFSATAGQFYDETFDIGLPQLELGTCVTTPIRPAAGSLVSSSRAADLAAWSPAGGFGGEGSVVLQAMLPYAASFSASQGLMQIDDGTDQNRLLIRNTSGGGGIYGVVDGGGTTRASLLGGSMVPGVPFRVAFAWAPGDQAISLGGGAVQSATAALPSGLARMLIGHGSAALNRAANGEIGLLDYRPQRLPNAMLQALSAAA